VGIRVNKSFKVAPGVRIRLGSKSSSVSVGGKAGRVTVNGKGRRTTTARIAPGVSVTSTSGGTKRAAAASQPATRTSAPAHQPAQARLGLQIAPKRAISGGWIAADDRAAVVHRLGKDDLRIPLAQVTNVGIEGKNLALMASGHDPLHLRLTTMLTAWDMKFVNAVANAAGLSPSSSS
jgi:hypothetical protein